MEQNSHCIIAARLLYNPSLMESFIVQMEGSGNRCKSAKSGLYEYVNLLKVPSGHHSITNMKMQETLVKELICGLVACILHAVMEQMVP